MSYRARRIIAAAASAILTTGANWTSSAFAQDSRLPQTAAEKQFHSAVTRAVFQLMPGERGRFGLGLAERAHPVFYGASADAVEQMSCERVATFSIIGLGNELGHISASACADGKRVRELSARAPASLGSMLGALSVNETDARKAGWYYAREALDDGSEFLFFPVLLLGHGVVGPYTGVLFERKSGSAIVVQVTPNPMCRHETFAAAPLCVDVRAALKGIVLALRQQLR